MNFWRDWYKLESETFINIDLLRFIASFGIVVFHYGVHCFTLSDRSPQEQVLFSNLNLFVDVFFVISGIVIHSLYRDKIGSIARYRGYLRKRLARLLPLHYATLAFFIAIMFASSIVHRPVNPNNFDVRCIPAQLTFTHAWGVCSSLTFNGPSWSISAEMAVYLLTPLLFIAGRRFFSVAAIFVMICLINAAIPVSASHSGSLPTRTFDFGVLRAIPAFLIGIWLSEHRSKTWVKLFARVPLSAACTIFLLSPLVVSAPIPRVLVAYALSASAYARDLAGRQPLIVRQLAPIGRLTYSVYMLQAPVLSLFVVFLSEDKLHLEGTIKLAAVIGSMIIVLPTFAILSLQLYELPLRRIIAGQRHTSPNPRLASDIGALARLPTHCVELKCGRR